MSDTELFEPALIHPLNRLELDALKMYEGSWDILWRRISKNDVFIDLYLFNTPRIQFSSLAYNNAIFIQGSHPKGSITLSLIDTNDLWSYQNQILSPYELVVMLPGEEMDYIAKTKNTLFTFVIEKEFFEKSFLLYFSKTLQEVRKEQKILLKKESFFMLKMMVEQLQHTLTNITNKKAYDLLEEKILEHLFSLFQIQKKQQNKNVFDISKARELLHANIQNLYTMQELIQELKISPRTLQHHFQKRLGLTPKQYFNYLKLNAIKEELNNSHPNETSITEIILKYGYFNSSYFSAVYKNFFGQTPLETFTCK